MTKMAHHTWPDGSRRSRLQQAGADLALAVVPLTALATTTWWLLELPVGYFAQVAVAYVGLALLLVWHLPDRATAEGLGAANRLTLGRATLILPLSAIAARPVVLAADIAWYIIGVATVALVLDGVDGWMARRSHKASPFGARFDMELDSFLMLVLSILVWRSGKVEAWAILIGLPRYLYVAAGWVWPMLRAELPPSVRRKAVCVTQGVLLLVCLGPIISPALATAAAASALAVLAYSFAVDILWLARSRSDGRDA